MRNFGAFGYDWLARGRYRIMTLRPERARLGIEGYTFHVFFWYRSTVGRYPCSLPDQANAEEAWDARFDYPRRSRRIIYTWYSLDDPKKKWDSYRAETPSLTGRSSLYFFEHLDVSPSDRSRTTFSTIAPPETSKGR